MSTDKTITAKIRHTGISASHIFSTPTTANGLLFNQSTWNKMHVNLWDYFIEINGRQPFQNEEIVFHIPYDSILIAPYGYK